MAKVHRYIVYMHDYGTGRTNKYLVHATDREAAAAAAGESMDRIKKIVRYRNYTIKLVALWTLIFSVLFIIAFIIRRMFLITN